MSSLTEIFKNRDQIWEGLRNKTFKRDHVEAIYEQRISICKNCPLYDTEGTGCAIKGTQPCCNKKMKDYDVLDGKLKNGCGCSLSLKARSLATKCPLSKWLEVTNEQEAEMIKHQIESNEDKN